MKRMWLVLLLATIVFVSAVQGNPLVYDLVRADGVVVARTETRPSSGDSYWDAESDVWYTVLSIEGTKALVGTQAEFEQITRTRTLRFLALVLTILLLLVAWYRTWAPRRR